MDVPMMNLLQMIQLIYNHMQGLEIKNKNKCNEDE